jgi:N-methylhydantoinase A
MPKLAARTGNFAPKSVRPVYFGAQFRDTPVFDRASLPPGGRVNGPAVVEEFGSTTVVFPGQYVEVDPHGILVIRPVSSQEPSR